ncbi:XrtA/PEP-CTERM system-associated ATPase [Vibrio algarum]|uniref:XrtA-associated ATPase n=1 Tax=Vibrio algarum TaxID=3020714 RepID=A0ABT4YRR1_9VIBR|nr:XrtA/PEP-CTERM system-associated ATPase [Vibrio sp. KJ40-1]MDB1123734.1 XrtA-associated ATPase [Vibrio sp. KJ40-1]
MYESHFGLSEKPFKLSPDPNFFFASAHHGKAISYLRYGLELGEGFIVITGPIGTGKTTIGRSLLASLNDSIVAAQIATTSLSPEELVKMVAAEFGLAVEGLSKADILIRLENFLGNLYLKKQRALLIIDEAQNLSSETIEELRMLSNFQVDDKPLIQSFLLGQEELKPIIELPQMEQFRQRIIASCHLKPFDHEETKNYILHRLKQAGWANNPQLKVSIFEPIAKFTQGIPRKINLFMDRLFLYAFMEDVITITTEHVEIIIKEMSTELSGSLQAPTVKEPALDVSLKSSRLETKDMSDAARHHKTLFDVTGILDDVIYRKTLTIRHLDQLIREKRKYLSNTSNDPLDRKLAESKLPENKFADGELVNKPWFKQLVKNNSEG